MKTLDANIEKKIDELLAKMTLHEKVGQLAQVHTNQDTTPCVEEKLRLGEIGGFLTDSNKENVNRLQRIAVEESRLGIPAIFGRDVIHGHKVGYPDALTTACSFNTELAKECYAAVADEASANGIHWTFSPMVDVAQDPRWGRIVEGPGEDPYLGSKMAAAFVKGFQGETDEELASTKHIAACAKHYVAYGACEGGRDYNKAEVSDYTLRNTYLPNFKAAVDAGVQTIMSSFNEISGQPVTSSHYLLTEILRDEFGFTGYVVSDDWSVKQLIRQAVAETPEDAATLSINAGLDMDMDDLIYTDALEGAVEKGRVSMETLDEAVRRVLRVKFRIGLFDHPYIEDREVDYDAHKALARKLAGESIVLLKNNGILPLPKDARFSVSGESYRDRSSIMGAWACDYDWEWPRTIEDGINDVAPETNKMIMVSEGLSRNKKWMNKRYDTVVLMLSESTLFEGEAGSLSNINIPPEQVQDILCAKQMGKKLIGVFTYGRPMGLGEVAEYFDAILWCGRLGTESGHAIADVLFGDVNPSGKLSATLPRSVGQLPLYYRSPQNCRVTDEYYGWEGGLENYRDEFGFPSYPFGYGLSYTTFEYSEPVCENAKLSMADVKAGKKFVVKVKVKNTGDRAGKETAQCYVRDLFASSTRPLRELKGFVKEEYAPGEEKEIKFELGFDELGFYHFDKKFYPEAGKFKIFAGPSCYADKFTEIEITD